MQQEIVKFVVMLHATFGCMFLFFYRQNRAVSSRLMAQSWLLETFRTLIILSQLGVTGGWTNHWHSLSDCLGVVAAWWLLDACAHLTDVRLPARLGRIYLGISIPLILGLRYLAPLGLESWFSLPIERAGHLSVFVEMLIIFVPVTVARVMILVWLVRIWRRIRLPGALVAICFGVPYVIFAVINPLQFYFGYYPDWIYFLWAGRVLGFSLGLAMLIFDKQLLALRESDERLHLALDAAQLGIWTREVGSNKLVWTPSVLRIFDLPPNTDLTYEVFLSRLHPDDRTHVITSVQEALARTGNIDLEYRVRLPDGQERWVSSMGRAKYDASGKPVRIMGVIRDITAQKQTEQHIRKLNRTHRVLSDINQLIVHERDPRKILDEACRIAVEKGGFLLAWVGGIDAQTGQLKITTHAGASPDTAEVLNAIFHDSTKGCPFAAQAIATGQHAVCNDIARDPLAEPWRAAALQRGYQALISLPLTVEGKLAGTYNLYADKVGFFDEEEFRLLDELAVDTSFALEISRREAERHAAGEKLRQEQELYAALASATTDQIYFKDREGRFLRISGELARHFRLKDPAEAIGKTDFDFFTEEYARRMHDEDQRIMQTGEPVVAAEEKETFLDGRVTWVSTTKVALRDGRNQITGMVGISRDITERQLLEEQLRQSQKMEAIGQLSGGIAHDFNNLLTVINGHLGLLKDNPQVTSEIDESLGEILNATNRAANLTKQLLMFSRRQVMSTVNLDLNEQVNNLTKMLRRILGEDVRMQLDYTPEPLMIHGDAGMIDQVLLNLAVNARDAMPTGGSLRISTRGETRVAPVEARRSSPAQPTSYVRISVSDTGTGIPPEIRSKIFEPFFTTKDVGKGTGLGLATVFGIVQQHRGWIELESELGKGTTFHVFFPRIISAPAIRKETPPAAPARGQGELILLVEDEASLMDVGVTALRRYGYQVLSAHNGPEALKAWADRKEEIKLLLTDIIMPDGMSGVQLARQILTEKPSLKVVYTSGYSAQIAGKELPLNEGINYLAKPYELDQLFRTVRTALDGSHSQFPFA